MRKLTRMLLLLFIIAIATKCQKEQSFETENINSDNPNNSITANIQGVVVDENGAPSVGALVIVGSKTTTTSTTGFFRIKDAALDKSASVVKIEKAGYFLGYRTFQATAGSNHIKIKLVKKQLVGTVNSLIGGATTLANGAKITLQANGVIKKTGGVFFGDVQVYAAYIDPTATDIAETVPGSFMADDKDNKRVTLKSFGMLAVELESASGEKLQIAPGKTAELKTPIPTTLLASSSSTIPLWYIDEQTGIWKEQGSANKDGNFYVGNVSHFSFWNCDVSMNAVTLSIRLVTQTGLPIVNALVNINTPNNDNRNGYTSSNGEISGLVPANVTLTMSIVNNCNTVIFTQNIGPLNTNTNLGNIICTNANSQIIVVSGNLVNCNGEQVSNGEIIFLGNYSIYTSYPIFISTSAIGNFGYAYIKCNSNPINIQIIGVDNTTQQQGISNSFTLNNSDLNVGTIVACGTSSSQFINYTLDGTNYSITNLIDSSGGFTNYYPGNNNPPYSSSLSFLDVVSSKNIALYFNSTNQVQGNYPLNTIILQNSYHALLNNSIINITNFPLVPITGFYEGNFTASYNDATAPTTIHQINGNFRIRRTQ